MELKKRSAQAVRLSALSKALAAFGTTPFVAAIAVGAGMFGTAQAAQPADDWAPGRILVMPRAGLPEAALAKILKENGSGKARRVGNSELRIVDLPPGLERQSIEKLSRHPHIKFAELDKAVNVALAPNDPYFGSQWHVTKIGTPTAWDIAQGNGVTIAIIDTGVESTHPDLVNQIVAGWNFYDNNSNTSPVNGHGTWVAGTAGATINNGTGVAAVAGGVKVMPLRVVDGSGVGYWSAIANAITYAADKGVRVANASFEKLLNSASVMSAAAYMKSKGGLVVVSAGNSGVNEGLTPNTSVIPVSATDSNDLITSWSSYGGYVAISAPGVPIYTTGLGGTYVQGQGTSFSSPIVAATVALMMSANPKLSSTEVEKLLFSTAVDLGAAGRDIYYGYGRVDAGAAVKAAATATTTTDTQAPTASIAAPLANSTVSGLVPINVSATDNLGVTKVELRVNGSLVATDTASPYGFSWDSTTVTNGMASLTATAYDAAGNSATSTAVAVNIANTVVADTSPPSVVITSPTVSTVKGSGSVTIAAIASDNRGTTGLKQALYIDGVLKTTVTGDRLSYSWSLKGVATGSHAIKVIVTDAAGNAGSVTKAITK